MSEGRTVRVQVNGQWRRVEGVANHPSGARYILAPGSPGPATILVRSVERSLAVVEGEGESPAPEKIAS